MQPEGLSLAFFVAFAFPEGGEVLGGGGLFGGRERSWHGRRKCGGEGSGWEAKKEGIL